MAGKLSLIEKEVLIVKRNGKICAICLLALVLFCSGCGLLDKARQVDFVVVSRDESKVYTSYSLRRSDKQSLSEYLAQDGFLVWEESETGQRVTTVNGEYADAAAGEYWRVTKNGALFNGPWSQIEAVDGDTYELVFSIRP